MNDMNTTMAPDRKDRKTGLVVFGIFEIILGVFCALMVPLMLAGMLISANLPKASAPPMPAAHMIAVLLVYLLLAVWFVCMGIGSIQAKRWARALMLVSSWFWLLGGLVALVFMLAIMPDMYDQMATNGQMPPQAVTFVKFVMFGFMVVLYLIIPAALVLFYGSKHVKATCEWHDPHVRWTDKCPLPVLALSLLAGSYAVCMPVMGLYGWTIPFFGTILNGAAGAMVVLTGSCLLGYLAWGMYRLRTTAWWCAVFLVTFWGASTGITFSRLSLMAFYEKMNMPALQLERMRQLSFMQTNWMAPLCVLWVVILLVYLLYTKKYFASPRTQ
jgi:hypothetical protein